MDEQFLFNRGYTLVKSAKPFDHLNSTALLHFPAYYSLFFVPALKKDYQAIVVPLHRHTFIGSAESYDRSNKYELSQAL